MLHASLQILERRAIFSNCLFVRPSGALQEVSPVLLPGPGTNPAYG